MTSADGAPDLPRAPVKPPNRGLVPPREAERLRVGMAALRYERERHGWTVAMLAERSGMSERHIARIERGQRRPSKNALYRLSRALRPGSDELGVAALAERMCDAAGAACASTAAARTAAGPHRRPRPGRGRRRDPRGRGVRRPVGVDPGRAGPPLAAAVLIGAAAGPARGGGGSLDRVSYFEPGPPLPHPQDATGPTHWLAPAADYTTPAESAPWFSADLPRRAPDVIMPVTERIGWLTAGRATAEGSGGDRTSPATPPPE